MGRKPRFSEPAPRIISVGTANPPDRYSQEEMLELFKPTDPRVIGLFRSSHIRYRHLCLPEPVDGEIPEETPVELWQKNLHWLLEIAPQAIERCLTPLGLAPWDIDYICTTNTTGFLCPSLSAHLIQKMGFRENVHRSDIQGMGCNAGLNGLLPVVDFARAHPTRRALLVCAEICSAAYVVDNSNLTVAVVNSLFGDGAAAALVQMDENLGPDDRPRVLDFESHIIPHAKDAMRFDLDVDKWSFFLARDIPYEIGENVEKPVNRLLGRHDLKRRHIDHWIVHSGGKKVIDSIKYNLGLTNYDVRHTLSVLKNYGNLSSASFLFSYQRLCRERIARPGDLGVMITMGPGVSIETALLAW
jgi:predicted naringenin-chalcone synthase